MLNSRWCRWRELKDKNILPIYWSMSCQKQIEPINNALIALLVYSDRLQWRSQGVGGGSGIQN